MILPLDLIETVSPDAVVLFWEGKNEKETRGSDQTHTEILHTAAVNYTIVQRQWKRFTQWWTFAAVETEHSGNRAMWCWHLYLSARRSYKIKLPVVVSHSQILLPRWLVTSWFLSLKCHKFKLPVLSFLFCRQWTKGETVSHHPL